MPLTLHFNKPVSGAFTGSFLGTISSASYATSGGFSTNANFAISASAVTSASFAQTSILAASATSASAAISGGFATNANFAISASAVTSASFAMNAVQAAQAVTSSYAVSASAGGVFNANTLIALTHTASVAAGTVGFLGTASFAQAAISASAANLASFAAAATSASAAVSGGFATNANFSISSSNAANATLAAAATSASNATNAIFASTAQSSSYATAATTAISASSALNATNAAYAATASDALSAPAVINLNNTFGADVFITQIPAAITEWDDGQRQIFDLTNYSWARMVARVTSASIAGAAIHTQYSLDNGSTWNSMSIASNGPSASLTTAGTIAGSWFVLNPTTRADVQIRWATIGGDAATGVKLGSIALHVK